MTREITRCRMALPGGTLLAVALIGAALAPRAGLASPAPASALAAAATPASLQYRITHRVALPGDEGWDDLTFEEEGGERLFISHGSEVLVVNTQTFKVVGTIADTPGVHGIALAPELGRGYVSAGRANKIVVFDLKSLARTAEIKSTGENPDAIIYDPFSARVFAFNGRGRNMTAIDAKTGTVVGTLPLDAKPEFAVSDGKGRIYVNLEDKNSLAAIDPKLLRVVSTWPLSGCEEPSGLALDTAGKRLFAGCDNKVMVALDATSGRILGSAPIGDGVDGARYDPALHLAFASCGEGVLTVVKAETGTGGAPEVVQSLATERGARTMTLDERGHRVFLVTANFGPPPAATADHPHPRPPILPGTFRLLVAEPGRSP
jgi:DNA-binding beta-propeller fold protein YncE